MAENTWKAYGDVNPLEHGGIWIREDEDCKGSFYIVRWSPDEEGEGLLSTGYVTPTDDWIDGEAVRTYSGIEEGNSAEMQAMAIFDYYGAQNFSGDDYKVAYVNIENQLKEEGIEV